MSYSPAGDTIAITRLAWDLYSRGYAVARDAPEEFKSLLADLRLLKLVLWYIRDKVTRGGKSCSDSTLATLRDCFRTLNDFEVVVGKYEKLGKLEAPSVTRAFQLKGSRVGSIYGSWSLVHTHPMGSRTRYHRQMSDEHTEESATSPPCTDFGRKVCGSSCGWCKSRSDCPSVIRIDQQGLQQSESDIGSAEQGNQNRVLEIETIRTDHGDADTGLPPIGRAGTTSSSSNTLCTHKPSFSAVAPSNQSTVTIPRSLTGSNDKPLRVPLHSNSSNRIPHQCSCAVHTKSIAKENDLTAPTTVHIEDASNPPHDVRSMVAKGPVRAPPALSVNLAQPLQLSERREKHNSDARIRKLFQQGREKMGNEMTTDWWLKLATWWFIKVGSIDGTTPQISNSSRSLLIRNSQVQSEEY